jgi:hypothetical protein
MAHKLIGSVFGLAAGAIRHVAWYVSHHMQGNPRERG